MKSTFSPYCIRSLHLAKHTLDCRVHSQWDGVILLTQWTQFKAIKCFLIISEKRYHIDAPPLKKNNNKINEWKNNILTIKCIFDDLASKLCYFFFYNNRVHIRSLDDVCVRVFLCAVEKLDNSRKWTLFIIQRSRILY